MKKYHFMFFFLLIINIQSTQAQVIGAEIVYSYQSSSNYEITLVNYYACGDQPISDYQYVSVFESLAKGARTDVKLSLIRKEDVTNNAPAVCRDLPSCIQKVTYKASIRLSSVVGGYDIVWKHCCLGNTFENIESTMTDGFSILSHIPELINNEVNSSPVFMSSPMAYACLNSDILSLQNAADTIDNDSVVVVFSQVHKAQATFQSNSGINGYEGSVYIDPPPYIDFNYKSDYSKHIQIKSKNSKLNPVTGEYRFTPQKTGYYLVSISAVEYRNGEELCETQRVITVKIN